MSAEFPTSSKKNGLCMNRSEIQFLSYKCKYATPILKDNWDVLLPLNHDFLTLIDREKVAFCVGIKELNNILVSGYFSEEEAKAIKRFRYQMKNNFAARKMRDNYRKTDDEVESEILLMRGEKAVLLKEKARLRLEIHFYQQAMN